MVWNKPRNVWQWLLVFSPAVVAIVASQTTQWYLPPILPLRLVNGHEIPNVAAHINRVLSIALDVFFWGSAIVALILSRGPKLGQRVVNACFFLVCLVFVNGFVAFAGCIATGAAKLTPSERLPIKEQILVPGNPVSR